MEDKDLTGGISRRDFLRRGGLAAAGSAFIGSVAAGAVSAPHADLEETTISDLQKGMEEGSLTSEQLVARYFERMDALDRSGPRLGAVMERNPDAPAIAHALDVERNAKGARGPLHGIPVLLKDNIDTADRTQTTAGSLALLGTRPAQDATVARKLREAGAVLLGKTNLSEWANIRSNRSVSGWSGRGGQCRNPYVITHNPCGSSSGSAVAVSANLCVVAIGTETDGSIVCPSHINGVVGIKPTLGLTSRAGVVPLSHSQDTIGTHARTVRDAAILLGAIAGVDPRDGATAAAQGRFHADYTRFLDPDGLRGARIGVARKGMTGYSEHSDRILESSISALRQAGAVIVDPADIPTIDEINAGTSEMTVLLHDFKHDLAVYLATRVPDPGAADVPITRTLEDVIAFNQAHADREMPYFGQELFTEAQKKGDLTSPEYLEALEKNRRIAGPEGIDKVMDALGLDALIAPTGNPAWPIDIVNGDHFLGASSTPAALAGYPLISVPAGSVFGLPVGITFMGGAFSEPTLIRLAHAFERQTLARRVPAFLETLAAE
jgi:amidase